LPIVAPGRSDRDIEEILNERKTHNADVCAKPADVVGAVAHVGNAHAGGGAPDGEKPGADNPSLTSFDVVRRGLDAIRMRVDRPEPFEHSLRVFGLHEHVNATVTRSLRGTGKSSSDRSNEDADLAESSRTVQCVSARTPGARPEQRLKTLRRVKVELVINQGDVLGIRSDDPHIEHRTSRSCQLFKCVQRWLLNPRPPPSDRLAGQTGASREFCIREA
jgi:hypothetical protein